MTFYRSTLDNAVLDIQSGGFDYDTVLKRTVTPHDKLGAALD